MTSPNDGDRDLAYATINGAGIEDCELHVPQRGPWVLEGRTVDPQTELSGSVEIVIGDMTLAGTIDPNNTDTFGERTSFRVLAGGGGWGNVLLPRAYFNDAGVKALEVAEAAAAEAGEAIDREAFVPEKARFGSAYVRNVCHASSALEDAIGPGVDWWVGFDGLTRVGARPTPADIDPERVEVLAYSPTDGKIELGIDALSDIEIGSVISERLDAPLTIRAYSVSITSEGLQVFAQTRIQSGSASRLAELITSLVHKIQDDRLLGAYRYQTVRMVGNRVELRSMDQIDGVPDLILVSQWPGVAGTHTDLAAGCEVVVQFLGGGNRTQPVITNFIGKGGTGAIPDLTELAGGGLKAARQGDVVENPLFGIVVMFDTVAPSGSPTAMLTNTPYVLSFGTVVTPPVVGTLQAAPQSLFGVISTGTSKVTLGD